MKKLFPLYFLTGIFLVILATGLTAQTYTYTDSWGQAGYSITSSRSDGLNITYSIQQFTIGSQEINREISNKARNVNG